MPESPEENLILIKRSNIPGVMPRLSSLELGELGLNVADGRIFLRTEKNSVSSIKTFLNFDEQPYTLNADLSSILPKYGNNTATEVFSNVLGGYNNDISGGGSSVINGENNDIAGDFSIIGSGLNNKINSPGEYSFIASGSANLINHPNVFTLGSNITSHLANFTYVNNLSTTGKYYGDGSELTGIISGDTEATTLVRNNSGIWGTGGTAQNLSFNSTTNDLSLSYGNTVSLSSLAGAKGEFLPLSGGAMTGSLTAIDITSTGKFYGDGSELTGIVSGDTEATTLVRSNSANWDSVYSTVQQNSAVNWNYQGTDLKALSANWQNTYTNFSSQSANNASVYTTFNSNSANWQTSYNTVNSLSANWQTTFAASSAYVSSNPSGITGASALTKLLQITQAGYNAITPASDTLYIIVG